jgi:hypothetical protein
MKFCYRLRKAASGTYQMFKVPSGKQEIDTTQTFEWLAIKKIKK